MTVHNHGSEEGAGLSCNESRLPDGSLQGACERSRLQAGYEAAERLSEELGAPVTFRPFKPVKKGTSMTLEFEDSPPLVHTEQTMTKVNEALESLGLESREIEKIVEVILDRGVFFRERSGKTLKKCGRDSCTATINADREGCAMAWREGWYLQKWGGPVWCPIHIPAWVPSSFVRQKEQEA